MPCDRAVVLIEDDEGIRRSVADLLQDEGYTVMAAEDGQRGLALIEALSPLPCLVLLDLMMPVMDGWQVLEALEARERLADVPVVVVTAAGGGRVPQAKNVRSWLAKPLRLESLLSVVVEYCGVCTEPPASA